MNDCAKVHLREQEDRGTQWETKEEGRSKFIQSPVVLSSTWDFILSTVESLEGF